MLAMSRLGLGLLLPVIAVACSGGGRGGTPLGGSAVVPELLACRSRIDKPMAFSEIALRTAQNLGTARVADRNGVERRARLHPDGKTLVFARERAANDPDSRELFTATIDGSGNELRLTQNSALDDAPCWSPGGDAILYTSERAGPRSLWLCDPDGNDPRQFLTPPPGSTDGQADWSSATDRIVFSRRDGGGLHTLWLVQGDGTGLTQLTDGGGAAGTDRGDHEPAFSPDGTTVVFVRRRAAGNALCIVPTGTGVVLERLFTATGDFGLPRLAPDLDRVFCGLAEPDAGRPELRLAYVPLPLGEPVLVWPDERYALEGLEFLPAMPALPAGDPPVTLDVEDAEVEIAWGSVGFGTKSQLAFEDGNAYVLRTRRTGTHETAGITCTFALPLADAEDVLELRIRAVAGVSRIGGDTELRISLYNPVEGRFDTAVEIAPTSTSDLSLELSTSSLRHVSREREIRFNVIGEVAHGDPAELRLDFVEVVLVARPNPD